MFCFTDDWSHLYVDTEHCGRRGVFLRDEDASWPRWSTHSRDRVQPAAILTAVLFAGWCAAQLLVIVVVGTAAALIGCRRLAR
ncbi:hypothetical protein [Streptomyces canus]|uniref:hypothetical protein n=1 Tax=Streptomyces canus TaxID=58343 RepID=UPI002E2B815B|nr:hypothetical protein [Streptomyces canus]